MMKSASPTGRKKSFKKGPFAWPFLSFQGKLQHCGFPLIRGFKALTACFARATEPVKRSNKGTAEKMRKFTTTLAALALGASSVFAQDAAPEAETAAEQTETAPEIGSTYIKEENGAWKLRCARAPIGKSDPCDMFQLLINPEGEPVAEMSVQTLNATGEFIADLVIIAPLGLLLPAGVQVKIDGRDAGRIPFIVCSKNSCVAKAGLKAADVQALKAGNVTQLAFVPADRSRAPFGGDISLAGFTVSFDKLPAPEAAAQ
jgi:invasion protein IalB